MRVLFIASLHHPAQFDAARRAAPPGHDPLFPPSQGQYFWVKALRKLGHTCAVFWRSESAWPWATSGQLRMTQRLTPGRAINALLTRAPAMNPDFRLRNRRLIRAAADFRPDVIILVGDNTVILPETLAAIKQAHNATLVYGCGTSPIVFSRPVERAAAPLIDLVIANDLYHAIQWRELGARRAEVLPMSAIDPDVHHPYDLDADEQAEAACDVGFIGTLVPDNLYGERIAALEALADFDLGIWSVHEVPATLRRFYRGPALGERMLRLTCGARIVVNPHGDFMRYGGNMRLFEACGVGAFQIADDRPGITDWFTVGEHLVTYRDPDHLRELVTYYLAHEDERRRIAAAGQAHVHANHTYEQRMARLMALVDTIRHCE
ncbi:MAG: glycosyltransferase [Anaerolineae bacterium]|nr:glycosyltransferase [Anaerolineae bacterium]